jgi:4-hydroxyphenylacetate 3-monooxygenase
MIKSGTDHIASLRDDRAVYLHGRRVDDVTLHPAYANSVKSIGRLFDFPSQHQ